MSTHTRSLREHNFLCKVFANEHNYVSSHSPIYQSPIKARNEGSQNTIAECMRVSIFSFFARIHFLQLTVKSALSMPPANETFFHVAMRTCFGMNVSAPTTPARMSHMVRSRTSTPKRSVRVIKSRSRL